MCPGIGSLRTFPAPGMRPAAANCVPSGDPGHRGRRIEAIDLVVNEAACEQVIVLGYGWLDMMPHLSVFGDRGSFDYLRRVGAALSFTDGCKEVLVPWLLVRLARSNAKIEGRNDDGSQRPSLDLGPRPTVIRPISTRLDRFRRSHEAAWTPGLPRPHASG